MCTKTCIVYMISTSMCVSIWGLYIIFHQQAAFFHGNFGIQVTVTDSSASSTKAVKAVLKVASSRKKKTPQSLPWLKKNCLERKTHEILKKKTSNQKWKSWVLQFNDDFVCMTRNPMITTQESRIIFFIVLVICW